MVVHTSMLCIVTMYFFLIFLNGVRSCIDFILKLTDVCSLISILPPFILRAGRAAAWSLLQYEADIQHGRRYCQTEVSGCKAGYYTEENQLSQWVLSSLLCNSTMAASSIQFFTALSLHPAHPSHRTNIPMEAAVWFSSRYTFKLKRLK